MRDKASYDILSQHISKEKLLLLPDMAFYLDIKPEISGCKTLYMQRRDFELDPSKLIHISNCDIKDWPTFSNNRYINSFRLKWMEVKRFLSLKFQNNKILSKFVDSAYGLNRRDARSYYVNLGIKFFSKYNKIYTTRLHGLILGVLMGKKMVIVDNKYNKCMNFYKTWLKDFDNIEII